MARYAAAFQTVSGTTATAAAEIRATSSDRPRLLELSLYAVTAAATVIGVGIPALIGVTPNVTYRVIAEDLVDPLGTTLVAVSWNGTAPTAPTAFYRRFATRALVGCPLIVGFPRGLVINPSTSLVLWNVQANPLLDVVVTVDE